MVKLLFKDINILAVSGVVCYVEFKTLGYIKWLLIGLRVKETLEGPTAVQSLTPVLWCKGRGKWSCSC